MRNTLTLLTLVLAPLASLAQNTCATALPVGLGQHTVAAVNGTPSQLICAGPAEVPSNAEWYTFTATVDTGITVSSHIVGLPDVDTRLHVYTGNCTDLVCFSGDDDAGPGYSSIASFYVTAGTTYTLAWDSYWSGAGFSFTIIEVNIPAPPEGRVMFTATPIASGGGIMGLVDMDNDGRDDAVSPGETTIVVNHQQAGGGFVATTYATTPADNTASWSFAIGDWDSNGHRDLLYGGGNGATFMKANADGTAYTEVTFPQYIFCQRTNFVDINNDGHLDAFSCHDVDANVAFLNDGSGNLTWDQGGYGTSCGNYGSIFTDYDNDGAVDLFIAKCGCDPVDQIMHNNGTGTFTEMNAVLGFADDHQSWSSAWGDFDNDGDMDVLVGSSSSSVHKLMRNNGDGTFTNVTAGSGMDNFGGQSIEWTAHDFNNDGWIDILGGGALHYNNGDGTFSPDVSAPGNAPVGDLNSDGFLDLASGSGYQRNNGNENHWIRIIPVGVESNRDAIGARVTVTSALGTQIRDIRSGDGFSYMSFIGAHFGLGPDVEVTEVTIHWPSGNVDVLTDLAINTNHTIVEGVSTGLRSVSAQVIGIHPNPAQDMVTFTGVDLNAAVEVYDAAGKRVLEGRLSGGRLAVGNLGSGVYQVRVQQDGVLRQARLMKP